MQPPTPKSTMLGLAQNQANILSPLFRHGNGILRDYETPTEKRRVKPPSGSTPRPIPSSHGGINPQQPTGIGGETGTAPGVPPARPIPSPYGGINPPATGIDTNQPLQNSPVTPGLPSPQSPINPYGGINPPLGKRVLTNRDF